MKKFSLNMYEMMEVLDRIHPDAYDKLQSALEAKICKAMSEEKWLKAWDSGNWGIEMVINVEGDDDGH